MRTMVGLSVLSADFSEMGEAVRRACEWGTDMVHFDVMDGSFVGPITYGAQMVRDMRPRCTLPFDCHLMVEHPASQVEQFARAGADIITVHTKACEKISPSCLKDTIDIIKGLGVRAGIALNPDEDVEKAFPYLKDVDLVLLMSVYPGYGGQTFIPGTYGRLEKIGAYASMHGLGGLIVEVDGGVTPENAERIRASGANLLVAGTSVMHSDDPAGAIVRVRGGK